MYWILGFAGRSEERWPVKVRIGRDRAIASALVRSRTDCSAPRPGLDIALPGQAVIAAIMADAPIEIEAEGPHIRLVARFAASENARRAAALMRVAGPLPTGEEAAHRSERLGRWDAETKHDGTPQADASDN